MIKTKCYSKPIGIGVFEPENIVKSTELMTQFDFKKFGVEKNWIDRVIGIEERRFSDPNSQPSDLGMLAAKQALEKAQLHPKNIGLIVFASIDRDYHEPATSHVIQNKLGAKNALCFDVTNACHSFINGIHLADTLIGSGQIKYALIVSGEQPSRVTGYAIDKLKSLKTKKEFQQYIGALTTGDSGAAMVLGAKKEKELGFQAMHLLSHGEHYKMCTYDPILRDGNMNMSEIVNTLLDLHAKYYAESMDYFSWTPDQIDHYITHQTGKKAFSVHSNYSGVPLHKIPNTVEKYGNLTSSTIPFNLSKMLENKQLGSHDKIFIATAGSGLSISHTSLVWG